MGEHILHKGLRFFRQHGARAAVRRTLEKLSILEERKAPTYEELQRSKAQAYALWCRMHGPDQAELQRQRESSFAQSPLISVVVPVFNTDAGYLSEMLDSLLAQTYSKWELCAADGLSTKPETLACLAAYEKKDARIRVQHLKENYGISGNTNEGLKMVRGTYIAFADHDDILAPDALFEVVRAINEQAAELIYTDEDKVDETSSLYYEPHLKPDYSPVKLSACNYFCHLMVASRKVLEKAGPLDSRFDGSQDHELALRICDVTKRVVHIPRVLYHWRQFAASMSKQNLERCQAHGRKAVEEHLARIERKGTVEQAHGYRIRYELESRALVSVILRVQGSTAEGLERVEALKAATGYEQLEFLLLASDTQPGPGGNVQSLLYRRQTGLYANLNRAAAQAKGEFLLFLDGALQPLQPEWLEEMLMFAQQKENGAVGGKLFLPDGNTIDRTAYVLRAGREPLPEFHGHSRFVIGNSGLERIPRNVSAVSCQAMLIRRGVFAESDGFDEGYKESYGDIDFCLRLLKRGYAQVFTPYAELRFLTDTAVQPMLKADAAVYRDKWQGGPADRFCHEGYEREVKEAAVHD